MILILFARYTLAQIVSVILVTTGVINSPLSASESRSRRVCIWHRYPQFCTCPVWLFGPRPRLDIFQVHSAIFIFSETESWCYNFDQGTWKLAMARIYVLPPFPCAPMLLPLLPDLAAQMEQLNTTGSRAGLSFPLRIPAMSTSLKFLWTLFCYICLISQFIFSHNQETSLFYQYLNLYQNKSLDGPLRSPTFGVGVYTAFLFPHPLKHDHSACLRSGSA